MKLVSYLKEEHDQLAILVDGFLYDMETIHPDLPGNMSMVLNYWEDMLPLIEAGEAGVLEGHVSKSKGIPEKIGVRSHARISGSHDRVGAGEHRAASSRESGRNGH